MRLLFVTQAIDSDDPVLSVYAGWVQEMSLHYEAIEVVCLKSGNYNLPANVRVHSLGKEKGAGASLVYGLRFIILVWRLRSKYSAVFVHMNQEYILLAGIIWKLLGKRIYFWYNHYAGTFLTDMAVFLSNKVFCTSNHSYTAKFGKTEKMPVGVDLRQFTNNCSRTAHNKILFLARMAPSKRLEVLLDACLLLDKIKISYALEVIGSPLEIDKEYYSSLRKRAENLNGSVTFLSGIPHSDTPLAYCRNDIFVNCSKSGMFDKTLFEAAACGCFVLSMSEDFKALAGESHYFSNESELASKLVSALGRSEDECFKNSAQMEKIASNHSLNSLAYELSKHVI